MPIAVNLSKCEKALCFLCKNKKTHNRSFYKDEWFLYSDISTYFTLFESDFINMTLGNCGWVNTTNSKASLFIVNSSIILIKHEIFSPKKSIVEIKEADNVDSDIEIQSLSPQQPALQTLQGDPELRRSKH